jgi:hypothetical protein
MSQPAPAIGRFILIAMSENQFIHISDISEEEISGDLRVRDHWWEIGDLNTARP